MSGDIVLELEEVTVRYGRKLALDGMSLALARGQVLALLGRNGAGKTTAIRCALGMERPAAGRARLFGRPVWQERAVLMRRVGYVPEDPHAPPDLAAPAIGRLVAALAPGFGRDDFRERLERAGVPLDVRFASLSRGERAQVGLALALAGRPELLVLDDPSLGLDAVARRALYEEIIVDLAERGTTVLIATHDLDAVERVATHVAVIAGGRIGLGGELEALKRDGAPSLEALFREAA
jgi:ABC-2 type transport system ATP-binding protein